MLLQVGVKILLKNPDGKYLLLRRNPKKYPEVGAKWDLPGGRIEPGTSLAANLKREIKEEVGLDLSVEPKLVAAQDILQSSDKHVVRLTYVGNIEGKPKIDEEHLEARWFSADGIKSLDEKILDGYFSELVQKKIIVL